MADEANTDAPALVTTLAVEVPGTGTKDADGKVVLAPSTVSLDMADIDAANRLKGLANWVDGYIKNRVRSHVNKYTADFKAYTDAMTANPLQSEVKQPAVVDYMVKANEAIAALIDGSAFTRGNGEKKPRAAKDPLIKTITDIVVRKVYDAAHETNPQYKWGEAVKVVGADGLAFLKARVDTQVANANDPTVAAQLRKDLEARIEMEYVTPAKIMLGQTSAGKKAEGLPSLF